MRAFAYLSDRTAGWIEKPRPHAAGYDAVIRPLLAQAYDRCAHDGSACATVEEKSAWMISRMDEIVKKLRIPTSLQEFGVPKEDLEGLVEAGMQVKRLLVNNMREITPDDARNIYLQVM